MSNFPNAAYAPYGINDNNFNRQSFPSNIFPNNGGLTGNPTGRFNPITTNTQNLMTNQPFMSNFNKAYTPNDPIIERIDYSNRNKLLHNNIADIVLDETVVEYRINIDSLDRDLRLYQDPFCYTVKFAPIGTKIVQTEEFKKCNQSKIVETKFPSTPRPHILREFKNVKYVKLENIILPQFCNIKRKDDCECDSDFELCDRLPDDRFVMLVIRELDCDRTFTTSEDVTRINDCGNPYTPPVPFAILIPDKIIGCNAYTCIPYYGNKIYKSSLLGNITQLTIQFFDSTGQPLKYDHLFNECDLDKYECEHGRRLPRSDVRHPLNKRIQTNLSLIFGVVESQINTNTKFDQ